MKRTQHTKPLMIVIFFALSMFIVNPVTANIIPKPIVDIPANGAAGFVVATFKVVSNNAKTLEVKFKKLDDALAKNEPDLIELGKKIEDSAAALLKWRQTADPSEPLHNGRLVNAVIIPMAEFKKIVSAEKLALSGLERDNFLSPALNTEKNSAYTLGDNGYDNVIGDEAMCNSPPSSPNNLAYAELQYDACRTVHNVTVYKRKKLAFTLDKKEQLEKAILAVSAVKDVTVGDHTAKKTVIAELKLLQQEVMDQYNAKMQFADVQIKASEHSRKYAAESIVGGSSVSTDSGNVAKLKVAAAFNLNILTTLVLPYH